MTRVEKAHCTNRYFLLRHGESVANKRGLIVSHAAHALSDFGLTSRGAEQVLDSAIKTRLNQSTLIISSDYLRARESADIFHSVIGCHSNIVYDKRLRERNFGKWELQDHTNYESIWEADLVAPETPGDQVESVYSVLSRVQSLISDVEQEHEKRSVLLVGHGDVLQILLAHHHNINARFHRSVSHIANADIRSLSKLDLAIKTSAA